MKMLLLAITFAFTLAALAPGALGQGKPTTQPSVAAPAATSTHAPTSIPSITSAPAIQEDNSGASAVIIVAVVVAVIAGATLVFLRWRRG
jgi:uncharacterized protein HemX